MSIIAGLKQLFFIENRAAASARQVLSLRAGEKHLCFSVSNKSGTELYSLAYCHIDAWEESEWTACLETYPDLSAAYSDIQVAIDFSGCALVPAGVFDAADAGQFLKAIRDTGRQELVITEPVPEWQLLNIYALPAVLKEWLQRKFPSARFRHQFTLAIRKLAAAGPEGLLLAEVREQEFTLLAGRNGKLLAAQTYSYRHPEDVVYYLLRACREYALSPGEVTLLLAGLVDHQSALYTELYQYFTRLEFRAADWSAAIPDYPAHFFTSLNDLARCVS